MKEFQLESCIPGYHIYKSMWILFLGEVYFLWLRGLTFDAMLDLSINFAFSRSVRVDDSHLIFLGSVGPSCENNLYKAIHVQTSLCVHSNDIQQNFGGYKIWQKLNLAAPTPIAKPPNFPATRYTITSIPMV